MSMRIGSAWKKTDKNGQSYLSVSVDVPFLGKLNFAIFSEKEKRSENSPDYSVVWSPDKK